MTRARAAPNDDARPNPPGGPAAGLSLLARLAAAHAVRPERRRDPLEHLAWVESGAPFEEAGVRGFLDGIPPALPDASPEEVSLLLDGIASAPLQAGRLGALYMKLLPRRQRHAGGEHYTPTWLVEHVLDRAAFGQDPDARLIDPMCGAGAFLAAAVARLRRVAPELSASGLAARVAGMDVNPAAVLMARAAFLHALSGLLGREPLVVPVRRLDAILDAPADPTWDVVAGNPPWVGWESLEPGYRERTKDLWRHHGLFADGAGRGGMQVMLGRGRKDLSMLATYAAADKFLRPGGRLAFVITQSVFKSVGAGAGFRRFVLGSGAPLRVERVDDLSARRLFGAAAAKTALLTLKKGEPTRYPVPYVLWGGREEDPMEGWAEPVDRDDPTSAWVTGSRAKLEAVRRLLGPSPYRARAGAYTGGANGVYWVRRLEGAPDLVVNLPGAGKRALPEVEAHIEPELLYPLLRASEVGRFRAEPRDWILLPQDPVARRGIDPGVMAARHPLALAYLERFAGALARRRDRGTRSLIEEGAPFYSIFSVSMETLAPWKVVWPRIASRLAAAAVGPLDGRPVVPQETCTFVACAGPEEAAFLAGLLGSSLVNEAARAFAQTGGKSFGSPHLLRHLALPRFDPADAAHAGLADLVLREGAALPQARLDEAAARVWR